MIRRQYILVLALIAGLFVADSVVAWPGDPTVNVPVTTAPTQEQMDIIDQLDPKSLRATQIK